MTRCSLRLDDLNFGFRGRVTENLGRRDINFRWGPEILVVATPKHKKELLTEQ